ncbi:MAG: endospore germination permease [Clostridia bacterium]|nr:endospore germination permease [Clostridia bacterium]
MQKETVSGRQFVYMIILFLLGSSLIIGASTKIGQDTWIAIFLAMLMSVPIILIYARIIHLFPEKNIFDIFTEVFGKVIGKILTSLIILYAIHLGALVVRNFSEFLQIMTMPETPQLPLMIGVLSVTIFLAKSGIEVLGRWSAIILAVVIFVICFTIASSINKMDIENFYPVLTHNFFNLPKDAFAIFSFPFAESVLFLALAASIKKESSSYKIYFSGMLAGGIILTAAVARNIALLGAAMVEDSYYPSYSAIRIINIGEFLTRIEGFVSSNFILTGVTKITICVLAASYGIKSLFNLKSEKNIILPVSLCVLALCYIVYNNTMQMLSFNEIYAFYAFPFQVLIPIALWIGCEIKKKRL